MTDHKLTGDDVIKALECCTNCICNHAKTDTECPLVKMAFCKNYLMKQSLALINRQKAEIERLQSMNQAKLDTIHDIQADNERLNKEVDRLSQCVLYHDGIVSDLEKDVFNAKSEAIAEFAERLTDRASLSQLDSFNYAWLISQDAIDTLVKEMTEENK